MSFTTQNRAFFKSYDPNLLEELQGVELNHASVEEARKGGLTLRLDGVYVHSKYDPAKECAKLAGDQAEATHVHFGLGLGYLLQADAPARDGSVVIFEPNREMILLAMEHVALEPLFRARNARLCSSLNRFKDELVMVIRSEQPYKVMALPFHARVYPRLHQAFLEMTQRAYFERALARRTVDSATAQLTAGALRALPFSTRLPGVNRLAGVFQGKPAVVVAAGPSLDRNLAELVPYAKHCVIIAIGRTAKPLEKWGIRPDFLVHNEPKPFYSFIQGCTNLKDTAFVLSLQGELAYYQHQHGPTFVFQNPANMTGRWLVDQFPNLDKGALDTAGSVANEAFSLANLMGCDPIVLMGQDLAVQGDRYYGHSETNLNFVHGDKDVLEVHGYFGNPVKTLSTYYSYILWYGDILRRYRKQRPHTRFINATEGGAQLVGYSTMKLADVAWRFFTEPVETGPTVAAAARLEAHHRLKPEALTALASESIKRIKAIERLCRSFGELRNKVSRSLRRDKGSRYLARLDHFKDDYIRLQTRFEILSGFMQAELHKAQEEKQRRPPIVASSEQARFIAETEQELEDLATTCKITLLACERLLPHLDQLAG